MTKIPLIPAQAGIQKDRVDMTVNPVDPRFRGDERTVTANPISSDR
jgi:hypothetical protein